MDLNPKSSVARNDNVVSEVPLEEGVENNQSCQQPDTELPTVCSETAMSECQKCAGYKIKLGRLKETYRKLKYRHRILREENRHLMCNFQVIYILIGFYL